MGKRGPAPKPKAPPPPPRAQGTGANKRTPTSAFDPAAGKEKDVYEPEKIVGQRMAKGDDRRDAVSREVGRPSEVGQGLDAARWSTRCSRPSTLTEGAEGRAWRRWGWGGGHCALGAARSGHGATGGELHRAY